MNQEAIDKCLMNETIDVCIKGFHFPEHIYFWDLEIDAVKILSTYFAHCAICGTDYELYGWKNESV